MGFWEAHGYFGGAFFVLSLLLLPRLTILFSVSLLGLAAVIAGDILNAPYLLREPMEFFIFIMALLAWALRPRFLIALIATILYPWNLVLVVGSWVVAIFMLEIQKSVLAEIVKSTKKSAEDAARHRRAMDETAARARKILEEINRGRATGDTEHLRRILEAEEMRRKAEENARRARSMQGQAKEWWKVLGVSKDASLEAIKAAYRKKARLLHPDSAPDGKGNSAAFAKATEAYDLAQKEKKTD
jgi:hypothetical protein